MLPPVSAVSAVDFSLQPASPRPETLPAVALVAKTAHIEQEDATAGASAMARAVSGELRLSQNVGVLAETLGKLLNIARMDGEASDAYVERLVTTMQSLPADARATLEKQLGSILRGISLSVLADALKNSAGPEAARLAVMFELARSTSGPRGTKPPVSSYLQDLIPQNLGALPQPARVPAAPVIPRNPLSEAAKAALLLISSEGHAERPVTTAQGADTALAKQQPASTPDAPPGMVGGARLPTAVSAPAQANPSSGHLPGSGLAAPAASSVSAAMPANDIGGLTAATQAPQSLPARSQMSPPTAPIPTPAPGDDMFADMAPIAMAQPNDGKSAPLPPNPFAGATAKDMEDLLLAAFLRPLPAKAHRQAQPLEHVLTPALPDGERAEMPLAQPAAGIPPAQDLGKEDEAANALQRADAAIVHQKSASAQELDAAILTQPGLHSAVAALIAKEGIPLPFINYPAAQDEQEDDAPPRGRWPSSEGGEPDEESGEGQPQGNPEQEERVAANDEVIDHSVSDGANDDGSPGSAESYYLKMSGAS